MVAETREHSVDIRGVTATLVDVVVAGHTVELVLSYDVEEAEAVHGALFNDSVDEIMQMEVAALGDTLDDGTLQCGGVCRELCPGWEVHSVRQDRTLQ